MLKKFLEVSDLEDAELRLGGVSSNQWSRILLCPDDVGYDSSE